MKAIPTGLPKIIMESRDEIYNYFAWPTVGKLKNGNIAVVASGFRMAHVCPFGKCVMSVSEDEGETYTPAVPVIDTVLDDRDGGICAFGKAGLIVTSFNNTVAFQRRRALRTFKDEMRGEKADIVNRYLDSVDTEREKADLGATFRISTDNGRTFGRIYHSPVTSPHGPCTLQDGTLLWLGRTFSPENRDMEDEDYIQAVEILPESGECRRRGRIPKIYENGQELFSCEPFAVCLPTDRILCHIRVQTDKPKRVLTVYQSHSDDGGFTWSSPKRILETREGAPSHILPLSDGTLVCTYGHRAADPVFAVKAIASTDGGESWSESMMLYDGGTATADLGYPSSVELKDGSILTVFYAHPRADGPANIMQIKWRLER